MLPALNEVRTIAKVVRAARKRPDVRHVILVDDGSTDGTQVAARRAGALTLRHPVNQGVGAALRDGFKQAVQLKCDTIVAMGADDQDRAQEIPRLLSKLREGYDFVQGSRWLSGGRVVNIPLFRRVTTMIYSALFTLLTRRWITDGTNGFRAFRVSILKTIHLRQRWLNTYELEPYLYYQAIMQGYRVVEVPVTKRYPKSGKGYTKMKPFRDWWRILRPLILLGLRIRR